MFVMSLVEYDVEQEFSENLTSILLLQGISQFCQMYLLNSIATSLKVSIFFSLFLLL